MNVRKLGEEKKINVDKNFDFYHDYYKNKAENLGYYGEIKIKKEHSKVIFFVVLDDIF